MRPAGTTSPFLTLHAWSLPVLLGSGLGRHSEVAVRRHDRCRAAATTPVQALLVGAKNPRRWLGSMIQSLILPKRPTGAQFAAERKSRQEDSQRNRARKNKWHAREVGKHWTEGDNGALTEHGHRVTIRKQTRRILSEETKTPPLHADRRAHLCARH